MTWAEKKEKTEREAIMAMFAKCKQKATATAQKLGMSRATLYRRLSKYGIERKVVFKKR